MGDLDPYYDLFEPAALEPGASWGPKVAANFGVIGSQLHANAAAITQETSDRAAADAAGTAIVTTKAQRLTRTAVKTASGSLAAGDLAPIDSTTGPLTFALPAAPADGTRVAAKHIIQGASNALLNTVTVTTAGSDVFNKAAGSTSISLPRLNDAVVLEYNATAAIWTVISRDVTWTALDARYLPSSGITVLASFEPAVGSIGEQLRIHTSLDGKDFTGWNLMPSYRPAHMRDPSLMFYNGLWYMAHTTTDGATTSTSFGIVKSSDLRTWTAVATVDCTAATVAVGGTAGVWAPEFFVDSNGDVYVFVAINDTAIYRMKATDTTLATFTTPVAVAGSGFPAQMIDAMVIKAGTTYHMFYKNEVTKYVEHATSTSAAGTFTVIGSGNWSGWGVGLEAPYIVPLADGTYRMYVDRYQASLGLAWASSADLLTWSALTSVTVDGSAPNSRMRHGSAVRVTDPDALATIYGSQPVHIYNTQGAMTLAVLPPGATLSGSASPRLAGVDPALGGATAGCWFYTAIGASAYHQLEITSSTGVFQVASIAGKTVVKPPTYSTATRPSASAAGAGAHYFDTTLGLPVWSNGTNWVDAAGTTR